jgi:MFS family permease
VEENAESQYAGRRRAIPLAGSGFFMAASIGGLGLIVQLYLKSLGAPTFLISLVATLNSTGLLFGAWLWGTISDRVKRRRLLGFLSLALALLIGMLAFLPPTGIVLGSAVFRFLFFSGFGAVAIAIISAASQEGRRGKNLSYVSSARAFGFAVGNIAAGIALQGLGFRNAFMLSSVLPLVAFGLLWLLPSENPVVRRRRVGAWRTVFSAGVADLFVATMLRQMATFGTFALLFVYMDSIGIAPGVMGVISASNTATQVLALLLFGWLADRVGRRPIFMLGFALSIVTPLIFVFAANLGGMVAGYVTLGIAFSSMYVGATAHIGDRVPHERHGQMMGLYESSRGLGGLFGPLIAGATVPLIGFQGMFLVMAGIAVIGFAVMLVGGRIYRASQTPGLAPR